jgi:glucokinase
MRLGIEIGGTKLQAAVGTAEGQILRLARADSPAGQGAAVALASAAALVQPERIVIGGGVAQMGDVLFRRLAGEFERRMYAPLAGRCRIVPAELLTENVVVGALLLDPYA